MGLISNGTTIFDNGSMASGFGGNLNFISKATASTSASIEFTSGIDSTYKEYIFYFVNIHPSTDDSFFNVNFSSDGGSNYNVLKTTTFFRANHSESGAGGVLGYRTSEDLSNSTSDQKLIVTGIGNNNDQSCCGCLQLFNPSSTTFVKHFITRTQCYTFNDYSMDNHVSGYLNTTLAVDGVRFQMSSGNIDSGEIILFGVS
jgi:hypothetical protein